MAWWREVCIALKSQLRASEREAVIKEQNRTRKKRHKRIGLTSERAGKKTLTEIGDCGCDDNG
jgi:hypothetical protein